MYLVLLFPTLTLLIYTMSTILIYLMHDHQIGRFMKKLTPIMMDFLILVSFSMIPLILMLDSMFITEVVLATKKSDLVPEVEVPVGDYFYPINKTAPPSEPMSSILHNLQDTPESHPKWWERLLQWLHIKKVPAASPSKQCTSMEMFSSKKMMSQSDGVLRIKPAKSGWYPPEVAHFEGEAIEWTSKAGHSYQGWIKAGTYVTVDEYKKFMERMNPYGLTMKSDFKSPYKHSFDPPDKPQPAPTPAPDPYGGRPRRPDIPIWGAMTEPLQWTSKTTGAYYSAWPPADCGMPEDVYKEGCEIAWPKGVILEKGCDMPRQKPGGTTAGTSTLEPAQMCKKNLTKIKNPTKVTTTAIISSPSASEVAAASSSSSPSVMIPLPPDAAERNTGPAEWEKNLYAKPDDSVDYAPNIPMSHQLKIKLCTGALRYPISEAQLDKFSPKELSELCKLPLSMEHPNYFKLVPYKDMLLLRSRNILVLSPIACASHNPIHEPFLLKPVHTETQVMPDLMDIDTQTCPETKDVSTQVFSVPGDPQWSSTLDLAAAKAQKIADFNSDTTNMKLLWGLDGGP